MYRSTLSLTLTLGGSGWSTPRPGLLTPGKTRYPWCRKLGEPQGRSGLERKISPPSGFDPRTAQPAACCYTDHAIPAHFVVVRVTYIVIFWTENVKGRDHSKLHSQVGMITSKWILQNLCGNWIHLAERQGRVANSCSHSNRSPS